MSVDARATKVSVVIPAFNRGYILGEAIQSVLDQVHRNFELIIVDDGSTDDTNQVVRGFKDGRIRLLRHPRNAGVAAARNTGLAAAQGEFISFLDSDDIWHTDKLARELAFLANCPKSDAVFTDLKYEGELPAASVVRIFPCFPNF